MNIRAAGPRNPATVILSCILLLLLLVSCTAVPQQNKVRRLDFDVLAPYKKHDNARSGQQETGLAKRVAEAGGQAAFEDDSSPSFVEQDGGIPEFSELRDIAPSDYKIEGKDIVQLDYEQVDLREIIEEIADALGITIVVDSSIGDKVTMRTARGRSLRHKDLWPLLRLLTKDAGVVLEKAGNVYYARKDKELLPTEIRLQGKDGSQTAPEILQITPLRHVSLETAINILKPVVEPRGRLIAIPSLNILGISASPDHLRQINSLLTLVDADPFAHRGLRLYHLKNAKAKELADELDRILKLVEGDKPVFQVLALERINSLLVVAPPKRGFREVSRWIEVLDEGGETESEQVFIYKVKNLSAKSLAATLTNVFKRPAKDNTPPVAATGKKDLGKNPKPAKKDAGKDKKNKDANKAAKAATPPVRPQTSGRAATADLRVNIVADEDTNSLLVRAPVRDYRQLLETIKALDQVPKEIMINTVIAEVTLTEETRFGVEWSLLSSSGNQSAQNLFGMASEFSSGLLNGLVLSDVGGRVNSLLNFLGKDTDLKVLSRPSILVRNNQEAIIKVGSEEPILTTITNSSTQIVDGNTQLQSEVQYRDTGIELTVTPHINDDGIINLEIHQKVSQIGEERTVYNLLSFTNREIKTSAVVKDGSAIVLGGIIQSRYQNGRNGIPGLMDIPLLGRMFTDRNTSQLRTELILIIIPEIIDPQEDNEDFMEYYLDRLDAIVELLNSQGEKNQESGL